MAKHAFYSMFAVGDYTLAPWKVVWSEQASQLEAAVVGTYKGEIVMPDHKVMLVACRSEEEAFFVLGVLNSSLFRFGVGSYAIEIQMDPHVMQNVRVPRFELDSELHKGIAAEAKRLSKGVADANDSLHLELDRLCKDLWGITDKELKAVEAAYRELYVSTPGPAPQGALELKEDAAEYDAEPE